MTDVTEQEVPQTEAEELASAMAGYNSRASQAPDDAPETPEHPVAESAPAEDVHAEQGLADKLLALKAEVVALKFAGDSDSVRKLHGEIGNINRTLQQLQKPQLPDAPTDDEFAAAMRDVEESAKEFEEVNGPNARALKALAAKIATIHAPEVNIDDAVTDKVKQIRQQDAIEALAEEHPDFESVRETPEYKSWLATKTPEFQKKFLTTWNPAVVSRGLTEFKQSIATKESELARKQKRLAAAETPIGVPQPGGPSTIPDEDGYARGYYRKRL